MPLKDSTETKQRWAVKNVEEVGWAVGQIQYGSYMDSSWSRRLSQGSLILDPGEEDQVGPCEQLDKLFLFNPLNLNTKGTKSHGPTPIVSIPQELRDRPMMPKGTQGATDRPYNLIQKAEHISCPLYLAVRVGEGRQLILVKTEKSGEKEKEFSIFFLVEQY